jgi:hypothetical protein
MDYSRVTMPDLLDRIAEETKGIEEFQSAGGDMLERIAADFPFPPVRKRPELNPAEEQKQIQETIKMSEKSGLAISHIDANYEAMQGKLKPPAWRNVAAAYGAISPVKKSPFLSDAREEVRLSLERIQSAHDLADAVQSGEGEHEAYMNWLKMQERARLSSEVLEQYAGPVKRTILKNIAVAAPMLKSYYEASPYAFGGAIAGMAIATVVGQLGPQVGAPEELLTVPAAGKVGAKAGFVVGTKLGVMGGTADCWYRQGQGDFYGEMLSSGADPKISRIVASIAAIPYAAIEYSQVRQFTPGLRTGVQQTIARSVTNVLAEAARKYGKTLMEEALFEEVLQDAVNIAAVDTANYLSGNDIDIDAEGLLKRANQLMATGIEATKSMVLLPGPNLVADLATGIPQAIPSGAKSVKELAQVYDDRIEQAKTPEQKQALEDLKTFEMQQITEEEPLPTEPAKAPAKAPVPSVEPPTAEIRPAVPPAAAKAKTAYQQWYERLGTQLQKEAIGEDILDEMIADEVDAKQFNIHFSSGSSGTSRSSQDSSPAM